MIELSKEALEYKALYEAACARIDSKEEERRLKREFQEANAGKFKSIRQGLAMASAKADMETRRAIVNFDNLIRNLVFEGYLDSGVIELIAGDNHEKS